MEVQFIPKDAWLRVLLFFYGAPYQVPLDSNFKFVDKFRQWVSFAHTSLWLSKYPNLYSRTLY